MSLPLNNVTLPSVPRYLDVLALAPVVYILAMLSFAADYTHAAGIYKKWCEVVHRALALDETMIEIVSGKAIGAAIVIYLIQSPVVIFLAAITTSIIMTLTMMMNVPEHPFRSAATNGTFSALFSWPLLIPFFGILPGLAYVLICITGGLLSIATIWLITLPVRFGLIAYFRRLLDWTRHALARFFLECPKGCEHQTHDDVVTT